MSRYALFDSAICYGRTHIRTHTVSAVFFEISVGNDALVWGGVDTNKRASNITQPCQSLPTALPKRAKKKDEICLGACMLFYVACCYGMFCDSHLSYQKKIQKYVLCNFWDTMILETGICWLRLRNLKMTKIHENLKENHWSSMRILMSQIYFI